MFGMQHTFKQLSAGIAIAAFVAVVAVPSAFSSGFITDTLGGNGSPKATPDAFERAVAIHEAWQVRAQQAPSQSQGMRFITDTLGGNGFPKATPDVFERAVAIHEALQAQAQARAVLMAQAQVWGTRVTDTPSGNGRPATPGGYNPGAYVNGGATPAVAKAIQDLGNGQTQAPSVIDGSSGTSFNWGDAGVGAGLAACLLLLILGGTRLHTNKRGPLAV
jgi:hypothetical protein